MWSSSWSGLPVVLLLLSSIAAGPREAGAGWPDQGLAVATGAGIQTSPLVVADGAGGALVSWADAGTGLIYLKRYSADGDPAAGWPAGGRVIGAATFNQGLPLSHALAPGDDGGAYVLWHNSVADAAGDVLIVRVTGAGDLATGWPGAGARVSTYPGNERSGTLVPDGGGGVFAGWIDRQSGYAYHARVQHYLADGSLAGWPSVAPSGGDGLREHHVPVLAPGAAGGVWLGWYAINNTFLIERRLRHILSNGTRDPDFGPDGFLLESNFFSSDLTELVGSSAGDVLAVWSGDQGSADSLIVTLRLTPGAVPAGGWPAAGRRFESTPAFAAHASIADGAGGAITAWRQMAGNIVRARRIDGAGNPASGWPATGAQLGHAVSGVSPVLAPDGEGGAIAAWADSVSPGSATDLVARHVDAYGTPSPLGAVMVCTAPGVQSRYRIASDGDGGAFVAWQDERDDAGDVYLKRIPHGTLTASIPGTLRGGGSALRLGRPVPNPSSGAARVAFEIGHASSVQATVYDVAGRVCRRLIEGAALAAGWHALTWDGRDEHGRRVSPGVYLVSVRTAEAAGTVRLLLID